MREFLLLAVHLIVAVAKLLHPGGLRTVAAESLLLKQQIIIGNRSRRRAPNLTSLDRFVLGLITVFIRPHRIPKLSGILKPTTLFKLHKAVVDRKYRILFSSARTSSQARSEGPFPWPRHVYVAPIRFFRQSCLGPEKMCFRIKAWRRGWDSNPRARLL